MYSTPESNHLTLIEVNDEVSGDIKIRQAAIYLQNGRTGEISGIRAGDVKVWLPAAVAVKNGDPHMRDWNVGKKWDASGVPMRFHIR